MSNRSGEVFVDVRANVGGYTVRLGPRFKKVISIEPNSRASNVLRRNVELNHLSNVLVTGDAISDTVGETTMNVPSSGKTTRSSIIEKFNQGTTFPVHTTILDSLLGEYGKIDLIKIDAEGGRSQSSKRGCRYPSKNLEARPQGPDRTERDCQKGVTSLIIFD